MRHRSRVRAADVKHTDGTSWSQGDATMALWTLAAVGVTVFKLLADSAKNTLQPLYGAQRAPWSATAPRRSTPGSWPCGKSVGLIYCGSSCVLRASRAERTFVKKLLDCTGLVFDQQCGRLDPATFVAWLAPARQQLEATLQDAVAAKISGLSGACADILEHRQALWNFVDQPGVEPTNNRA